MAILALFQMAFGACIFYGTKNCYLEETTLKQQTPDRTVGHWSEQMEIITPALLDTLVPLQTGTSSVENLAEQANLHFTIKRYASATSLYEQLIDTDASQRASTVTPNCRSIKNLIPPPRENEK